jgi:hypothetical protein
MNTFGIAVIRMAGGTLLDDPNLISLPRGHFMDVAVAVLALNLMSIMGTRIMFRSLLLVAAMAGGRLRFRLGSPCLLMLVDISHVLMAACAGVGCMNGSQEFLFIDFLAMATQTIAVGDEPLKLCFRDGRLCFRCHFRRLFLWSRLGCGLQERRVEQKKDTKNDQESWKRFLRHKSPVSS